MIGKKCLIFDQDGTLYPAESLLGGELRARTKQWIAAKLGLTDENIDSFYASLSIRHQNPFIGFESVGASVAEYHQEVFDKIQIDEYLNFDIELVNLFKLIPVPKFIVTFASPSYSRQLQERLGIKDFIADTLFVRDYSPLYSKESCYRKIRSKLRLETSDMCVIGDNFYLDVLPGLNMGCRSVHISKKSFSKSASTISSIYDLQNLLIAE